MADIRVFVSSVQSSGRLSIVRKKCQTQPKKCQTSPDCQATKSVRLLRRNATHSTGNFGYGGSQVSHQNIGSIYQ